MPSAASIQGWYDRRYRSDARDGFGWDASEAALSEAASSSSSARDRVVSPARAFSFPPSSRMTCSEVSNTASTSFTGISRPSFVAVTRKSSGLARPSPGQLDANARRKTSTGFWCWPRRARAAARNAAVTCAAVSALVSPARAPDASGDAIATPARRALQW